MCVVGMMIKARFFGGGRAFGLFTTSFVVDCRGDNGRDSSGRGIRGGCLRASRGGRGNLGGRSRCGSGGSRRNRGCVLRERCAMGGSREGGGCSRGRSSGCRWC